MYWSSRDSHAPIKPFLQLNNDSKSSPASVAHCSMAWNPSRNWNDNQQKSMTQRINDFESKVKQPAWRSCTSRPGLPFAGGSWKQTFHPENASNVFRPHHTWGILKRNNQRLLWILGKLGADYLDAIGFEKLRFRNVFPPLENKKSTFSNSFGLKSVFEKLRFRNGFVRTVGRPSRRNKAAFPHFSSVVLDTA